MSSLSCHSYYMQDPLKFLDQCDFLIKRTRRILRTIVCVHVCVCTRVCCGEGSGHWTPVTSEKPLCAPQVMMAVSSSDCVLRCQPTLGPFGGIAGRSQLQAGEGDGRALQGQYHNLRVWCVRRGNAVILALFLGFNLFFF